MQHTGIVVLLPERGLCVSGLDVLKLKEWDGQYPALNYPIIENPEGIEEDMIVEYEQDCDTCKIIKIK